jgi:hypothetical protein
MTPRRISRVQARAAIDWSRPKIYATQWTIPDAPRPCSPCADLAPPSPAPAIFSSSSVDCATAAADTGGAPDMSSQAPAAASRPIEIARMPPWIYPDENSIHFDNAGDIVIPAIGVENSIITFSVPKGQNGVLKTIANALIGGGFTDGSGAIAWRVLQNGQAVRGKENMLNSLGSVANPSKIGGGGFIRILENDVIQLTVFNVSLAPAGQIVAGRLSGWFYPKDQDPQGIWF